MLTGIYPDAIPGRRYTIGDTAKLLGIHRNTLRKYTEAQEIHAIQHSVGRRLFYTGREINDFWNRTITR